MALPLFGCSVGRKLSQSCQYYNTGCTRQYVLCTVLPLSGFKYSFELYQIKYWSTLTKLGSIRVFPLVLTFRPIQEEKTKKNKSRKG